MNDSHKRTLLKTASYRGGVTIILGGVTWFSTSSLEYVTEITVAFNIIATVFYYVHERLWNRIKLF